jgi:hypothetical protein
MTLRRALAVAGVIAQKRLHGFTRKGGASRTRRLQDQQVTAGIQVSSVSAYQRSKMQRRYCDVTGKCCSRLTGVLPCAWAFCHPHQQKVSQYVQLLTRSFAQVPNPVLVPRHDIDGSAIPHRINRRGRRGIGERSRRPCRDRFNPALDGPPFVSLWRSAIDSVKE